MTEPRAQTWAASPGGLDGLARAVLVAAAAGTAVAVAAAYAYYNDPWRPLAHVLAPWAVLAVAVAFRRPPLPAVAASVASLASAVVTFYVGLKVGHDIRWADSGSVMSIDWDRIQLWLVLACLAGGTFGLLGATAARRDWRGAAATAAVLGLLLGEAYRRSSDWGLDVAVAVDAVAAVLVFAVATRVNRRRLPTLALTAVAAVVGFAVVSAPDLLERLPVAGR